MIELLVGITIGLMIVGAATALWIAQLRETREVVLEARAAQDLRLAADLMARGLRRSGYWSDAGAIEGSSTGQPVAPNPYAELTLEGDPPARIDYRYDLGDARTGAADRFGFRFRDGSIEAQLGGGNWQALTDNATLTITELRIAPQIEERSLADSCRIACPADDASCPPRVQRRSVEIELRGHATHDPKRLYATHSRIHLRNDVLLGQCPSTASQPEP